MDKNFYIKCNNNEEFIFAQKHLFEKEYLWYSSGRIIKTDANIYPVYLYSTRTADLKFVYHHADYMILDRKLYDIKNIIRKNKLKKLNLLF